MYTISINQIIKRIKIFDFFDFFDFLINLEVTHTSYLKADMRIVPIGSSGKIGRNLGFLTKEYILTLVLIKISKRLGKSHDVSYHLRQILSFNHLFRSTLIWFLNFGKNGSAGMPAVPATILMSGS